MPRFSQRSLSRLQSCDERLQDIMNEVIKYKDITIIEGHRSPARQAKLYKNGSSRVRVSKHNASPSRAIDISLWDKKINGISWKHVNEFNYLAGYVLRVADEMGVKIRWGGDWDMDDDLNDQRFNDLCHFELI